MGRNRILALVGAIILALGLSACSEQQAPVDEAHADGWILVHGGEAQTDLASCATCHGPDFTGNGGAVSCFDCHFDGPPFQLHPAAWANTLLDHLAFADDFSWGYRLLMRATYNDAIGPVTIEPRLAWAHDVSGTTPGPGGSFVDGRKTLTLGLGFNYLQKWIFDFSYTNYMGGGRYNLLHDRDFFGASVRYSF